MRNHITMGRAARRPLKAALLSGAALVIACSGAAAQLGAVAGGGAGSPLRMRTDYLGYAASVSPRVGYSDNIELAPKGLEKSTALLSTFFSGSAIYSSKRFTGIANGDLDLSFRTDNSDFFVNQNVGGAGTFTVADNALYVDVAGSSSRQLLGDNARFSQNLSAARNQRANVNTYSVSPYIYHEFVDNSSAQLRYRFSQVFINDDNAGANPFRGDFLNDSRSQEVLASYNTGSKFQRFRFALSGYGNRTIEDGSVIFPRFKYEQGTVTAEMQLALSSSFFLSGAVGYDDINTDTFPGLFDDNALSGVFWRAGFAARPGRRSSVRIEYGRRYDDDFVDASISYDISSRLSFTAGAGQRFETRAQQVSSQFVDQQRSILEFADRLREGAELSPDAVIEIANRFAYRNTSAQTAGIGVSKVAYAQLRGAYDRTEILLTGDYQDTDFGFRRNKIASANLNVRRELSRRLTAYGGVFYRRSDTDFDQATCTTSPFLFGFDVTDPLFDPVTACNDFAMNNGLTKTLGGRVGAAYRLYENLSVFGEYSHTKRFADFSLLEYDENTVVGGLTLEF